VPRETSITQSYDDGKVMLEWFHPAEIDVCRQLIQTIVLCIRILEKQS
jgi:hypothetical protein